MKRKKICWITPDYFVDSDINIIPLLCERDYSIEWIVTGPEKNPRYPLEALPKCENLTICYIKWNKRLVHPQNILFFVKLFKTILSKRPDLYYMNYAPEGYFMLFYWLLPFKKMIATAHQGRVHDGFRFKTLAKFSRWLYYSKVRYVNMFSEYQAKLYQESYKPKYLFMTPLALKDFGEPTAKRSCNPCRFLSFGTISYNKNIELLIDAAEKVYDQGYKDIKVSINGYCENWDYYQNHIKHPEIFELSIRKIDNNEIANLFSSAKFFVQPYRILTQSGPTKIAFRYNLPIIASNRPTFVDEIQEGIAGFIFESENVNSLTETMIKCIKMDKEEYDTLLLRMKKYVDKTYSSSVIIEKYRIMFNTIMEETK